MKRRATTGGKVGKARRRSVKRRHVDRRIPTLTDLAKQLREERRENAETRRQLSEALEQQTATSEVLQVISSSPGDLEPVFQAMLENAIRICEAKFGMLFLCGRRRSFRSVAVHDAPPALVEARRHDAVVRPARHCASADAATTKQVVHVADIRVDQTTDRRG